MQKPTTTAADVAALIRTVYLAFAGPIKSNQDVLNLKPAAPISKSISADFLICLEDGLKFKSLRRHLYAKYGLTPDAYREKWKLPRDYPMAAPSYSAARSRTAKASGLGQKNGSTVTAAPTKFADLPAVARSKLKKSPETRRRT